MGFLGLRDSGDAPAMRLIHLIAISLVPFAIGLFVALWDRDGRLLRYYPFRLAGVLLPLGASLLAALVVQRYRFESNSPREKFVAGARAIVLSSLFIFGVFRFQAGFHQLGTPIAQAEGSSYSKAWVDMCVAAQRLTPRGRDGGEGLGGARAGGSCQRPQC